MWANCDLDRQEAHDRGFEEGQQAHYNATNGIFNDTNTTGSSWDDSSAGGSFDGSSVSGSSWDDSSATGSGIDCTVAPNDTLPECMPGTATGTANMPPPAAAIDCNDPILLSTAPECEAARAPMPAGTTAGIDCSGINATTVPECMSATH